MTSSPDIDATKFHYYDEPQRFTVDLSVSGRASLTILAETADEAREKAENIIDDDDFSPDIDDVDDVDIRYVTKHPARTYLIHREGSPGVLGTSRLMPGDKPREPDKRDREIAARMGYRASWHKSDDGE